MTTIGSPRPPIYHRVETSVRPARVASLIPDVDDWIPAAQRMIELFSRAWGGRGDILVPTSDDGTVSDDLWRLLERFDPDRLGYHLPTHRGWQMADPAGFERWLDQEAKRWAGMTDVASPEEARRRLLDPGVLRMPLTTWEPPPALEDRARQRLAPLDPEHPFDQAWVSDGDPGRELLDMGNIRELEGPPVLSLRAEAIDRRIDLMVMNRVGAVAPSFRKVLKERGVEVVSAEANRAHLRYVLDLCWASEPKRRTSMEAVVRAVLDEAEQPSRDPAYLERTPFAVTELGCRWYVVGRLWGRELPYVVVTGDAARDFCFAMGLDRMYGNAIWVPFAFLAGDDELSGKVRSYLAHHLDEVGGYGSGRARPVVVTSLSIDRAAFEAHAGKLWALAVTGDLGARVGWVVPGEVEMPKPMRLYDPDQLLRQRWEPFVGPELAGAVDTPKPSGISEMNPMGFTWHVDVAIDDTRLPPRSCLNHLMAVLGETERESVRASSDGISYFSREPFFIPAGATIEQMMYRPRLRLPDPTEIFKKLLEAGGLRGVVSQAGRYTQGVLDLWGGLAAFAADLRDSRRLALLEAYRKISRSGVDPGVYLDGLRRRFLSLWDVRRATGATTQEARELLDEYLQRGILSRGLCLKCPRCNFAAGIPPTMWDRRLRVCDAVLTPGSPNPRGGRRRASRCGTTSSMRSPTRPSTTTSAARSWLSTRSGVNPEDSSSLLRWTCSKALAEWRRWTSGSSLRRQSSLARRRRRIGWPRLSRMSCRRSVVWPAWRRRSQLMSWCSPRRNLPGQSERRVLSVRPSTLGWTFGFGFSPVWARRW